MFQGYKRIITNPCRWNNEARDQCYCALGIVWIRLVVLQLDPLHPLASPCLKSSARYAPNFSGGPSGPRARNFSAARRLLGLQSGIHLCNHSGAARRAEPTRITRTNICVTDLCFLQTSSDPLRVLVCSVCLCRAPQKRAGSWHWGFIARNN